MSDVILNRVEQSGLVTVDLEDFLPSGDMATFDLKEYLFMGMILKEKEFREALKALDWSLYKDKNVALDCSADAIIPSWAYMLVVTYLSPVAKDVYVGTETEMFKHLMLKNIASINTKDFESQRLVVKGCGDVQIDAYAYAEITRVLVPLVKSIMYGEPCSSVPFFKKKSAHISG